MSKWITVAKDLYQQEASMLKGLIEQEGIPCNMEKLPSITTHPVYGYMNTVGPEGSNDNYIQVPGPEVRTAHEIIRAYGFTPLKVVPGKEDDPAGIIKALIKNRLNFFKLYWYVWLIIGGIITAMILVENYYRDI